MDQSTEMLGLPVDDVRGPLKIGVGWPSRTENFHGSADRGERIPQFMGQDGQELALAAIRLGQLFHPLPQTLFQPLAFGNVSNDAGEEPTRAQGKLAYGQLHRECGIVLAAAGDFSANADDLRLPRPKVAGKVLVVFAVEWLG